MIASLCRYYDRLLRENVPVAKYGWEKLKVEYCVHLNEDGSIKAIESTKKTEFRQRKNGKQKEVTTFLSAHMPIHAGRTSNFRAYAFCDKVDYVFGINADGFIDVNGNKGAKYESETPKLKKRFETAQELAHTLLDGIDSPAAKAYLRFYDTWDYKNVATNSYVQEHPEIFTSVANFMFCYDGFPIGEDKACAAAYDKYIQEVGYSDSDVVGTDMITGETGRICRVHKQISGAYGFNSTGAQLCCANKPALKSYGREKGYGFPMTETTVFKYTTALNYLISQRGIHSFTESLGKVTYVFWSETASEQQDHIMMSLLSDTVDSEIKTNEDYIAFIRNVCTGYPVDAQSIQDEQNPVYHVIGIDTREGANVRICMEMESGLQDFAASVVRHYEDCAIDGCDIIMTPRKVLLQCLQKKSDGTPKDPGYKVYNDLVDAISKGHKYPPILVSMLLERIATEAGTCKVNGEKTSSVTAPRAAILKAVLCRNYNRKDIGMSLNIENSDPAYVLGRILAVGESIQYKAMKPISCTLSQRYMCEMMRYPSHILPEITKKVDYYINKIRRNKPGLAYILEQENLELYSRLEQDAIPARFTSEQSCMFLLGYKQQRKHNFDAAKNASEGALDEALEEKSA